jgi:hypothetical protein
VVNKLLSRLGRSDLTESDSIDILMDAIQASGGVGVVNDDPSIGFDLGVWSDDLDAIGGNPLPAEMKRSLRPGTVDQALRAWRAHPTARARPRPVRAGSCLALTF